MEKMSGESMNLLNENIEKLKALFPEIVTDGKIDFDMLKTLLGEEVDASNEKYSFNWVGKRNCIKFAQTPSTGTLIPCREKSVDFDNTQNIYIEGDNVEALKLLQKTYFGKIKMIYIDPPYNTGNDFVYHDDYKDSIENYKKITGQQATANPETNGRFHTDWLNMMYPRLKLAKDLLSDDGVIFISIDDNEQANLKKICDEVFGENNFIAEFPRVTKKGGKSTDTYAKNHDYIIAYSKNINNVRINGIAHIDAGFKYKDKYYDMRGPYKLNQTLDYNTLQYNKSMDYPITINGMTYVPGGDIDKQKSRHEGIHGKHDWVWRWSRALFDYGYANDWIEISSSGRIYTKTYLNATISKNAYGNYEIQYADRTKPVTTLDFVENDYSNDNSNKEITKLMGSALFDYVKPTSLIKLLLLTALNDKNGVILDFFSGSATTAHAVMQLNAEDGGNRKFIMVQLPELCDEKSEAYKAGYKTICDIGEERIRRAGAKIKEENPLTTLNLDTGFKVFRLDSTNIVPWNNAEKLDEMRLYDYAKTIKDGRDDLSVAYEIMLKYGVFDKPMKEAVVSGKKMYDVGEGYMIICLADGVTMTDVEAIARLNPHCVVFKESGFADDNEKINATHTLERGGVEKILCI